MTLGMSKATRKAQLAATYQQTAFVYAAAWRKLHLGDPGPDGTDNPCVETTRINLAGCFGTDPDDTVTLTNDAPIGPWPTGTALESPTHFSDWSADDPGGTFIASGTLDGLDGTESIPIGNSTVVYPGA